jgi:hypothetical protein
MSIADVDGSNPQYNIEPVGNLTFLITWQFQMMASDQTSLYSSLIVNSINASISNCMVSCYPESGPTGFALRGLEIPITAMTDDILVSYSSAQLILANNSTQAHVTITIKALQFGEREYVILVVALKTLLILLVIEEAIRTHGWENLASFDYMNPRNLLVGSSRGGSELAEIVEAISSTGKDYLARDRGVGKLKIVQKEASLTLVSGTLI